MEYSFSPNRGVDIVRRLKWCEVDTSFCQVVLENRIILFGVRARESHRQTIVHYRWYKIYSV